MGGEQYVILGVLDAVPYIFLDKSPSLLYNDNRRCIA